MIPLEPINLILKPIDPRKTHSKPFRQPRPIELKKPSFIPVEHHTVSKEPNNVCPSHDCTCVSSQESQTVRDNPLSIDHANKRESAISDDLHKLISNNNNHNRWEKINIETKSLNESSKGSLSENMEMCVTQNENTSRSADINDLHESKAFNLMALDFEKMIPKVRVKKRPRSESQTSTLNIKQPNIVSPTKINAEKMINNESRSETMSKGTNIKYFAILLLNGF